MKNRKNPPKTEGKEVDLSAMTDGRRVNDGPAGRGAGRLDPRVRAHIGRKIKAVYDEVVQEPVPDRFLTLLDELAKKERESE